MKKKKYGMMRKDLFLVKNSLGTLVFDAYGKSKQHTQITLRRTPYNTHGLRDNLHSHGDHALTATTRSKDHTLGCILEKTTITPPRPDFMLEMPLLLLLFPLLERSVFQYNRKTLSLRTSYQKSYLLIPSLCLL